MDRATLIRRGPTGVQIDQGHEQWLGYVHMGVVLVISLALIYVLYRVAVMYSNRPATTPADPLGVAKARYAAGEITKEQLADIKKELAKTE